MKKPYRIVPTIIQRCVWMPIRLVLRFFLRIRIKGLENLAGLEAGAIFASNHSGELDVLIIPSSLPFFGRFLPLYFMSREKGFYKESGWRQFIYGGALFEMFGALSISAGKGNYELTLTRHIQAVNQGLNLCIFPEGGVSRDGKLGRARGGVGYLAWKTGHPVVPVSIVGNTRLTLSDFLMRRRHVTITFGKPIVRAELFTDILTPVVHEHRNDFAVAAERLMARIERMRNDTSTSLTKATLPASLPAGRTGGKK